MEIGTVIDYFNPFSEGFKEAIQNFKYLENEKHGTAKKAAVIALTILGGLATFFILFLGAIPAFRWSANWIIDDSTPREPVQELREREEQVRVERRDRVLAERRAHPEEIRIYVVPRLFNRDLVHQITDEKVRTILQFELGGRIPVYNVQGYETDCIMWKRDDIQNDSDLGRFCTALCEDWPVDGDNVPPDVDERRLNNVTLEELVAQASEWKTEILIARGELPDGEHGDRRTYQDRIINTVRPGKFTLWQDALRIAWENRER